MSSVDRESPGYQGLNTERKQKIILQPYTKKTFVDYWSRAMSPYDFDMQSGIVRVTIEKSGEPKKLVLYENFEEGRVIFSSNGAKIEWRGSEHGWKFNNDDSLKMGRKTQVGIVEDLKTGKETLLIRKKLKGNQGEISYSFTH